MKFEKTITAEELKTSLIAIEKEIKTETNTENRPEETSNDSGSEGSGVSEEKNSTPVLEAEEKVDLQTAQVIEAGDGSFQIKSKFISTQVHDEVIEKLKERHGNLEESRFETIGPTIGSTMRARALVALLLASLMILIYLAFAFRKIPKHVNPWRFGACAIIALIHDLFFMFTIFLILGAVKNVEIDALFITALLTILGFSVHDTIVVFDRIRERLRGSDVNQLKEIANISLSETMARSINTSFSTLLTLLALLFFGSSSIFYFILALTCGVLIGTYSSIFIASPILILWTDWANKRKEAKLAAGK